MDSSAQLIVQGFADTRYACRTLRRSPSFAVVAVDTGNYFDVLGVTPAVGCFFHAADDQTPGNARVAVLVDAAAYGNSVPLTSINRLHRCTTPIGRCMSRPKSE